LSSADTETEAEAAPASDSPRDELVASVRGLLGDAVVESHVAPGLDVWVRVTRDSWAAAAEALQGVGFTFFDFLSAIDWSLNMHGKNEEPPSTPIVLPATSAELAHGTTGGDTRFQLLARVFSPESKIGLHLKCDLPDDDLRAPTWSTTYMGADWHEREVCEMFGIFFDGHPNLTNIYLPTGFEGNPLRKDFPLLARHVKPWPGLVDVEAMPGEPDEDEAADGDADATEGAE
jgi:NADH-quinone oxidoreductase subunit C